MSSSDTRVHLSFANTSSGKLTIEISTAKRKDRGHTVHIPRSLPIVSPARPIRLIVDSTVPEPIEFRDSSGASHICKNTSSGSFLLPSSSFLLAPDS